MKKIILFIALLAAHTGSGQSIDSLYRLAVEQNPELKASYARFEGALNRVTQRQALPDAKLSLGYFISPIETRLGPQQARLSLNQQFPWWGTRQARGNVARLQAEAAYQQFLQQKNELYAQLAGAWYPLAKRQALLRVENENLVLLNQWRKLAVQRLESNKGSLADVLQIDLRIEESDTRMLLLAKEELPLRIRLNRLLNRTDTASLVIPDQLPVIQPQLKVADSLLNPALAVLDRKIEAARGAERLAVKEGLPSISVGLDYALIGERTDAEIPENGRDVLMPLVSLSLPVFRNKYRAKVEESRNLQQELQAEQTATRNRLQSQLAQSRYEQDKLQVLLSQYERQVQLINRTLNLLLVEYSNREAGIDELLSVQSTLLKYQRQQIEATMAWWINRADIQVITGATYIENEE